MRFKRKIFETSEQQSRQRIITKFLFWPKTLYVGDKKKFKYRSSETRWLSNEKIIQNKRFGLWIDDCWLREHTRVISKFLIFPKTLYITQKYPGGNCYLEKKTYWMCKKQIQQTCKNNGKWIDNSWWNEHTRITILLDENGNRLNEK
jgi:hypothetical protein